MLVRELAEEGITRHGRQFDKGAIYQMLNKPVYIGKAVHKGTHYDGEHAPSPSGTRSMPFSPRALPSDPAKHAPRPRHCSKD
jgi:hypothetical protein